MAKKQQYGSRRAPKGSYRTGTSKKSGNTVYRPGKNNYKQGK